ncbi:putative disease resistance RPP13-like protein 1 [Morella rubra]|uniref:Putative disease resistance RPP13-like protein 1 n=1 Tax=Morella rubra TaxID=262757 RepID=A0A6A1URT9_9ROSI|nr:putative disease resistance RPP13-like protein 1 [Morella rubra]
MVAVGELFLSAFIQMLVQQLLYPELVKFASREGIGQKLDKWKKTLSRIQAVLDDAEDRQHIDGVVKQWLDDLKDLAYDVDDILDEFNTEVLRSNSMGENRASKSNTESQIMRIIAAAGSHSLNQYLTGSLDIDDDMEEDRNSDPDMDIDSSREIVYML